jgi:hypothetical protein
MRLGAGPVFSYYEFKWPLANRLTDEAWFAMLENHQAPAPPAWTQSFRHPVVLPPADDDHDQLPDAWERSVWGDTSIANDSGADPDGDGLSNLAECSAHTDPRRSESCLRVTATRTAAAELTLAWTANAGQHYRVFTSDNLRDWYLLGTPIAGQGEQVRVADALPTPSPCRFYRVQALPW